MGRQPEENAVSKPEEALRENLEGEVNPSQLSLPVIGASIAVVCGAGTLLYRYLRGFWPWSTSESSAKPLPSEPDQVGVNRGAKSVTEGSTSRALIGVFICL